MIFAPGVPKEFLVLDRFPWARFGVEAPPKVCYAESPSGESAKVTMYDDGGSTRSVTYPRERDADAVALCAWEWVRHTSKEDFVATLDAVRVALRTIERDDAEARCVRALVERDRLLKGIQHAMTQLAPATDAHAILLQCTLGKERASADFDESRCACPDCAPIGPGTSAAEWPSQSNTPVWHRRTPWAVKCREHGRVYLSNHEYNKQMNRADSRWHCPVCGEEGRWDDDNYEEWLDAHAGPDVP